MKRTIRNGMAVVGMAGGMWLLGHAVANAATDATPPAGTDTAVTQTVAPPGGSSSTDGTDVAKGTNDNSTSAGTGDTAGGNGGGNGASANTGATDSQPAGNTNTTPPSSQLYEGDPSKPVTTVTIVTGDVSADQQANGGTVADSGNVSADSSTTQQAAAQNTATQSSTTTGGDQGKPGDKPGTQNSSSADQPSSTTDQSSSSSNNSDGGKNVATSGNDNSTSVSTGDISGGNGGSNSVDINTGLIGTTFNCPAHSTCIYNITTGDVTVYQQANGGNVSNSGNVTIGNGKAECGCKQEASPPPAPAPTPSPTEKTVAKKPMAEKPMAKQAMAKQAMAKKVVVLSGAQPRHALATTGAETSAPLTAGLIALGAGTALTLAGRRRRQVEAA